MQSSPFNQSYASQLLGNHPSSIALNRQNQHVVQRVSYLDVCLGARRLQCNDPPQQPFLNSFGRFHGNPRPYSAVLGFCPTPSSASSGGGWTTTAVSETRHWMRGECNRLDHSMALVQNKAHRLILVKYRQTLDLTSY